MSVATAFTQILDSRLARALYKDPLLGPTLDQMVYKVSFSKHLLINCYMPGEGDRDQRKEVFIVYGVYALL